MRVRIGWLVAAAAAVIGLTAAVPDAGGGDRVAVKALVIAPTPAEIQPWIDKLGLATQVAVPGLSPGFPAVACNADGVCAVATGAGKANAAATLAAIAYSGAFDLTATYFVIAELARIDPARGTTNSVVWVGAAVDAGIAWELDARAIPAGWTTGYLGIDAVNPTTAPPVKFGTEVFALDPAFAAKATALASGVRLEDTAAAQTYRALYAGSGSGSATTPATGAPAMLQGATASSDTAWHGALLGQRTHDWVALIGGASATYTTMQQADNAALATLEQAGAAGLLDAKRIAVLHAAVGFDRPHPGQTAFDSLRADAGASGSALDNLVLAGAPVVADIVAHWSAWQSGVPQ